MVKNINKVFGIVLYVIASILFVYTIWALAHNIGYIGELISSGQLEFAGNEYDIISFYMTNCVQFAVFAIILFVLGWIVARKPYMNTISDEPSEARKESSEEELDDWFDESTGEK